MHTLARPAIWQGGPGCEAPLGTGLVWSSQSGEVTVGVLQGWADSREIGILGGDKHPVLSGQPGSIFYHLLDGSAHQP